MIIVKRKYRAFRSHMNRGKNMKKLYLSVLVGLILLAVTGNVAAAKVLIKLNKIMIQL